MLENTFAAIEVGLGLGWVNGSTDVTTDVIMQVF